MVLRKLPSYLMQRGAKAHADELFLMQRGAKAHADELLQRYWPKLVQLVGRDWLPPDDPWRAPTDEEVITRMRPGWGALAYDEKRARAEPIRRRIAELGCGGFGCVYATRDQGVVLKLTHDHLEAWVAAAIVGGKMPRMPGVVRYDRVVQLNDIAFALWREPAEYVGFFPERVWPVLMSDAMEHARELRDMRVDHGPEAVHVAFALWQRSDYGEDETVFKRLLQRAAPREQLSPIRVASELMLRAQTTLRLVQQRSEPLRVVAEAMEAFLRSGMGLPDVRIANLGMVPRMSQAPDTWAIVDPSLAFPISPDFETVDVERLT